MMQDGAYYAITAYNEEFFRLFGLIGGGMALGASMRSTVASNVERMYTVG